MASAPLVPRSVGALAFLAAQLADERYAAAWQFRQYGYWIGRIDAVRELPRREAMDELWSIYTYLGGNNDRRIIARRTRASLTEDYPSEQAQSHTEARLAQD